VRRGKEVDGHYNEELVDALADLVDRWKAKPWDRWWVTWVPSLNHPELVPDLAKMLATKLGVPAVEAIKKTKPTQPQKTMQNSAQQLASIKSAFDVRHPIPGGTALLVDDVVDSRWTLTHVGSLLKQSGCTSVMPLVPADSGGS
jgi:ATP-dependent DNA helicase RecQ